MVTTDETTRQGEGPPASRLAATAPRVIPDLGADRLTAPAGDAAGYVLHYAGPEPVHAWAVDGVALSGASAPPVAPVPEAERGDAGALHQSAHRVTCAVAGTVAVTCNGREITLAAT